MTTEITKTAQEIKDNLRKERKLKVDRRNFENISQIIFERSKAQEILWQKDKTTGALLSLHKGYLFLSLSTGSLGVMRVEKLDGPPIYLPQNEDEEDNIVHDSLTNSWYRTFYDVNLKTCLKDLKKKIT